MNYPVEEVIPELKRKLNDHLAVILQAPPGAGKSTVVPIALLHEPWLAEKKIIMLQPRRLASRAVASRMSELLGRKPGETVGYRIRHESVVSKVTRIEVVTEGILTRMMQDDNALEQVGLVVFDEFHERSIHADFALALCRQVQQILRNDLRILIMSATLDGEKISTALGGDVPIVSSVGRQFPVELKYEAADKNEQVVTLVSRAVKKALREDRGDVLVFLPGAGEIVRVKNILEEDGIGAQVLPLYGDLPFQKQQQALSPLSGLRKVVLATSIAETSLTIEGITTVIDSGLSRLPRFDPRSGLTKLETVRVTRDAADQRAGRAGRLGPGVCYRLWGQSTHQFLAPSRQPEILEADLASLMLELFNWGAEWSSLNWITPPPFGNVSQAIDLLEALGAIKESKITSRGKEMLRLPAHPRIAHMLLSARSDPERNLAIDIASIIDERDPLPRESGADLSLRIEALRKGRRSDRGHEKNLFERIEKNASAWRKLLKVDSDYSLFADTDVGRLLLEAYPERIARQIEKFGTRYKLANGRVARLPEGDALIQKQWLVVASLDMGGGEGKIFLAAPVDETDLEALADVHDVVRWDTERGMIDASRERRVGSLVISSRPLSQIADDAAVDVICRAVREEGLRMLGWGEVEKGWQARVMSLRTWRPDEGWPDVSDESLLDTLHVWLAPYLVNIRRRSDLQKLDVSMILMSSLSWELQRQLYTLAPVKMEVPSGSMIALEYSEHGAAPVMKVRLQEVFGMLETPTVNGGRSKIILHLLSPGFKPVQVTQDLKSFWQSTYHEVRQELRRRYPKHSWPEDPWTATAVRGAKRNLS